MVIPQSSPLISLSGLPALTSEERRCLLSTVTRRLQAAIRGERSSFTELGGLQSWPLFGVYISLKRRGDLRLRCGMGSMDHAWPLREHLNSAAILAATGDPRFPKLRSDELSQLRLEVWLFAYPEPVYAMGDSLVEAIDVRRHGLIVNREERRGTLLPGMIRDAGWDSRAALTHACVRAGLGNDAWLERETRVELFESTVIEGDLLPFLASDDDDFPEVPAAFRATNDKSSGVASARWRRGFVD